MLWPMSSAIAPIAAVMPGPMVSWAMYRQEQVTITSGTPKTYASSANGRRKFCGNCGTGLFYTNDETLPGIIDVQSATYDDPAAVLPSIQVQVAERIDWMKDAHTLPGFERYPPQE